MPKIRKKRTKVQYKYLFTELNCGKGALAVLFSINKAIQMLNFSQEYEVSVVLVRFLLNFDIELLFWT
jgi:hypothetical protein